MASNSQNLTSRFRELWCDYHFTYFCSKCVPDARHLHLCAQVSLPTSRLRREAGRRRMDQNQRKRAAPEPIDDAPTYQGTTQTKKGPSKVHDERTNVAWGCAHCAKGTKKGFLGHSVGCTPQGRQWEKWQWECIHCGEPVESFMYPGLEPNGPDQ
jgi:hypothetical protein